MRQLSSNPTSNRAPKIGIARGAASDVCAAEIMDTLPLIVRYIRKQISRESNLPVSVTQVRVLAFLSRYPGLSLSELAEHLCVTKATASTTIERMVKAGLVDRQADPKERRCVVLQVTKSGAELYGQAHEIALESVAQVIGSLPANKLAEITKALTVLRSAFDSLDRPQSLRI